MSNSLCNFSVDNLSVESCILELVKISLGRKATSIAVRFNPKRYKIQVVDNGIGFTKYELSFLFSENKECSKKSETIFDKISSLSNAIIVTSKSEFSSRTYVKIASATNTYKLFEGYDRPSKGTTVTIYEFNCSKWDIKNDKNSSISYVIAAIAFTELKISFSLRNDDQDNLILDINNPHSPWEVLKYLKNNEACEMSLQTISQMIQRNTLNYNERKIERKEVIPFSPLNISPNRMLNDQNNERDNNEVCSPLSEWSDWSYSSNNFSRNETKISESNETSNLSNNKTNDLNTNSNSLDHNDGLASNSNRFSINDDSFISLTQMSIWSDWSYESENLNHKDNAKDRRYKFLPISIYKMLPYSESKILGDKNKLQSSQCSSISIFNDSEIFDAINETTKYFQNIANVRMCDIKHKLEECRISGNIINSLQILRQFNKEFIVAIANENGKNLLILIDQHAAHERIRYEWLIETYREKGSNKYYSVKLTEDLLISNIEKELLRLIVIHKDVLNRVGINIKTVIDSTTCTVDAVPKCFVKNVRTYKHEHNLYRLIKNVRQLLLEVADGLAISESVLPPVLPISINNVIASEACHEAIKFGDPLTVKECKLLMQALKDTKAPMRCAHGRPSIVPLMELSGLEKRKYYGKVHIIFII